MAMLEVDSLSVEYAVDGGRLRAVDGATFSLGEGRALGIAGESACGKSSLGMALMRSLPAGATHTGSARLDGADMLAMGRREFDATHMWKRVAMVFQAA
ncbi:MAG: ATP-binding cassette domain-containing protein, partial [Thaumarchaeota archaeon]|nr:ATP-binding cassette domain-containing protein [Nitrososphaerota archaeon]